jgi:hypothetical protein
MGPFVNTNGIASFNPGSARFREGLPCVAAVIFHKNAEWTNLRYGPFDPLMVWHDPVHYYCTQLRHGERNEQRWLFVPKAPP